MPGETITWRELILDALYEINAYAPGEPVENIHIEVGRRWLNRILDSWRSKKVYAYNVEFNSYVLTAGHQPHLIGPGLVTPDFDAPRPARIENAALILAGSTPIDKPLTIRDDDWWAARRIKTVTSSIPTDLYPSFGWPNVALYLWPIPTAAHSLRLETWTSIDKITEADLDTDFAAPYGYELATMLTLAQALCRPMAKEVPATLAMDAKSARDTVIKSNAKSPRISLTPYMETKSRRGDFNYLVGGPG
jgi:hypothetical protein